MEEGRVTEIEERWKASTPGEWDAICASQQWCPTRNMYIPESLGLSIFIDAESVGMRYPEDIDFCAQAHQDIPDLIAALREARALARGYRAEIRQMVTDYTWEKHYIPDLADSPWLEDAD